jgi:site-specific DNA recombinase
MPKSREPTRRSSRRLRCAIYTRKSSDEGLEQAFNSLDAQREACAAFVLSQKHEGWSVLSTLYDDGGYSGGTLDRPALRRLLADIADGKVDVVVVYKIDRLTRSLFDFAKIVEAFDARGVSFVSITQQFNTTTSMGRLTLNVLLSFAQFEREVAIARAPPPDSASAMTSPLLFSLVLVVMPRPNIFPSQYHSIRADELALRRVHWWAELQHVPGQCDVVPSTSLYIALHRQP